MKSFHRLTIVLTLSLVFACLTAGVSAFTLSSVNVSPRGGQAAGTPMTVSAVIDFPSTGTDSFPSDNELRLSTDLLNPRWAPVLVLDGREAGLLQESRESLTISGYYLSYPPGQTVQVRVTLTGNLPEDVSPGRDLLSVQDLDPGKNIVKTARLDLPATPEPAQPAPAKPPEAKISPAKKIFTPIPIDTTTPASPAGAWAGIIATTGAALLVLRRR
jgi:hypothetical protein